MIGVRALRAPASWMPSASMSGASRSPAASWAEWGGERRLKARAARCLERGDRAAAGRAHEIARETLLSEPRQAFQTHEGHVHEHGNRNDHVDAHPRANSFRLRGGGPADRSIASPTVPNATPIFAGPAQRAVVGGRDRASGSAASRGAAARP